MSETNDTVDFNGGCQSKILGNRCLGSRDHHLKTGRWVCDECYPYCAGDPEDDVIPACTSTNQSNQRPAAPEGMAFWKV